MSLDELRRLDERHVIGTYARQPLEIVRGEGARVWDAEGNEYLDLLCGISVTNLGHCHPAVVEAVREQAGVLMHASNLFYTEPGLRLADTHVAPGPAVHVLLCTVPAAMTGWADNPFTFRCRPVERLQALSWHFH